LVLLLTAAAFVRPPVAHAAITWNVTPSSACTLADAIIASDTSSPSGACAAGNGGGVINLASGIYTLNSDLPAVTTNQLTITGAGPGDTTIDGQNTYGVIYDYNSAPLTVANVTIARAGGSNQFAVLAYGPGVTVQNVAIRDSTSVGGIYFGLGAGVTDTVKNVAVVNMHDAAGGGITANISGGIVNITNTTLDNDGRGVWVLGNGGGTVNIVNSTIANNSSSGLPAGVEVQRVNSGTSVYLKNSILSHNTASGAAANCGASQTVSPGILVLPGNQGHNIVSDGTCALVGATNKNSTDPLLSSLSFLSGTYVLPINSSSPAFDGADPIGAPSADQRGVSRPQCAGVDIGAYEIDCGGYAPTGDTNGGAAGTSGGGTTSANGGSGAYYNGPGSTTPGAGGDPSAAGAATLQTLNNNPGGAGLSGAAKSVAAPVVTVLKTVSANPVLWGGVVLAIVVFAMLLAWRGGFWFGRHRKLIVNRTKKFRKRLNKTRRKLRRYFALP
jgi:hypothetical protein